ncbi:MAG: thermonuclease family protein [Hyphomonadaceae bacterium]
MRALVAAFGLLLAACGPQLGELEEGERGRVVRAFNGDTLMLDNGMRVFLAEIDAPRGEEDYAAQSQGELEALALHRQVRLAYGGAKRWTPRPRPNEPPPEEPPPETAIAHVYVRSEGGRWFWLQHELVARGAAYVRPRRDNHARSSELAALEAQARSDERGLWARRVYRPLSPRRAAEAALAYGENCLRGPAPYRIVEGVIESADVFERRASLSLGDEPPFALVVFGPGFAQWDGPALGALNGARVRARGPLGVYLEQPQLCLDHASQLEVLPD